MVNSRHKRYSLDTGPLKITAQAMDGVDEIVEDKHKTFYVGVQFHPESLYKIDSNMNAIFKNFLTVCIENKKSNSKSWIFLFVIFNFHNYG